MGIVYRKLPDKGNYEVYEVRKKPIFIIFYIIPSLLVIFFLFFADSFSKLSVIIFLLLLSAASVILAITERSIIKGMFRVTFKNKAMKKEGPGMLNFTKPSLIYIEK